MRCRTGGGRSAVGEQELTAFSISVDRTPHCIPHLRHVLPLVEEDGAFPGKRCGWVGSNGCLQRRVVQVEHCVCSFGCSCGLSDPFCSIDRDGCQLREELIQFVV